MRVTLAIISAVLLAVSAMGQNTCFDKQAGLPGICIRTSQCSGGGGTYHSGYCPNDPADVKCCTYGTCTYLDGQYTVWGGCMPTAACRQSGNTPHPGVCRGGTDIQCCPM
ncbi:hypothetical protein BGX23_002277 [Mortierella sp. AD031]|nr:hypothetical protein BGX23_002277 [Mortierella sp. AD031]KAG0198303.1 hypothetical protein BGX33_012435 [Mortierella sp. NVP41]